MLIIEDKSAKGDGYYDILLQACNYSENDALIINAYLTTMKGTLVSFYAYIQDYYSSNQFYLKGGHLHGILSIYYHEIFYQREHAYVYLCVLCFLINALLFYP